MNWKTCSRCICSSNMPGVDIDAHGICSECVGDDQAIHQHYKPLQYEATMNARFERLRSENIPYHAMVMLSGGKDSTYLLYLLKKKYNLRPLAFAVLHPFVNSLALENIKKVTGKLNVDLITFSVDESIMRRLLRHGILHGPDYGMNEFFGCSICSSMYHQISLKMTLTMKIPYLLDGRSPGEVPHPYFVSGKNLARKYLEYDSCEQMRRMFRDACEEESSASFYNYSFEAFRSPPFPAHLSPFSFMDYDYEKILRELAEADLLETGDAQPAATNCEVQHFFACVAYKRYHCHPYTKTFATGIRRGIPTLLDEFVQNNGECLTREELITALQEWDRLFQYIIAHPEHTVISSEKRQSLAPFCSERLGERFASWVNRLVSIIPHYSAYFDVDLASIQ